MKEIKKLKNIKNEEPIIIDDNVDGSAAVNEVITINDNNDLTIKVIKPIHPRDRLRRKLKNKDKSKRKLKNKKADVQPTKQAETKFS